MKNPIVNNLVLLLIALIWGFGFVPQRLGMEDMGPAAFNALRFGIGAATLFPIVLLNRSITWGVLSHRSTIGMGLILGGLLFGGATFQQVSIQFTSLANVAFITGLYVIVVPIIGFFIGYKYKLIVWIGGLIAMLGLYLMTGSNGEIALKGDMLALIGAVFWAIHLLVLARKAGNHNQLVLAFYQFTFCAVLSAIGALMFEDHLLPTEVKGYLWPAVNGFLVVGIAYTLQVMVMEFAEPFSASLILSLEAVFGAIAGYFIFSEQLASAALVGAFMMLFGCILAQLPGSEKAAA